MDEFNLDYVWENVTMGVNFEKISTQFKVYEYSS
jgi:hypothetical protein